MQWKQQLEPLEFIPSDGPEPRDRIEELERLIGVALPADYRGFLLDVGGADVRDGDVAEIHARAHWLRRHSREQFARRPGADGE